MRPAKGAFRRAVVFDLDDTLYLESDYAGSGFVAVGEWAKAELGLSDFADRCRRAFASGERGRVFDAALAAAGRSSDRATIAAMVEVYRHHEPDIALASDASAWLDALPEDTGIALVTDGYREAQARKIAALGLADRGFAPIVITDRWGRDFWKPHPRAFETVADELGLAGSDLAYVADNPAKDFIAPRRLGWRTVQIARSGRVHHSEPPSPDHRADTVIATLDDLDAALAPGAPAACP